MSNELLLQSIVGIYTVCNAVRLLMYVPQMVAVMRDRCGAHAISLTTWTFWAFSNAVTAVYCQMVTGDVLLAGMMLGNATGCLAVVALTIKKRWQFECLLNLIPGLRAA